MGDSMVWVIHIQPVTNEFSPDGEFRGHAEALAAHYNAVPKISAIGVKRFEFTKQTLQRPTYGNGDPYTAFSYYYNDVNEKFCREIGVPRPHKPALAPLAPHEWPQEFVYKKTYTRRAALVEYPGLMCGVEEGLREVIERVEPGVHLFNPIKMTLPKKLPHTIPHHMMIVTRFLNSYSPENNDPGAVSITSSNTHFVASDFGKTTYSGVAMSSAVFGNAHLWRERWFRSGTFFMSDHLKAEIDKAGLRLPPHFKMKQV